MFTHVCTRSHFDLFIYAWNVNMNVCIHKKCTHSLFVTKTLDDSLVWSDLLRNSLGRFLTKLVLIQLLLVEARRLHLTTSLECRHNALILPANLVGQASKSAELAALLQSQDFQGRRHNNTLHFVVGCRYALKHLHPLQSLLATVQLVRQHATYCSPEDLAGSTEVVWTFAWVGVHSLPQKLQILQLVSVKATGDVDIFASEDDDTLTLKDGLGYERGQTAQKMSPRINN